MSTILPILFQKSDNLLLLKDGVGQPKPTIRRLPAQDFVYGKQVHRDNFGMKEITSDWQQSHHENHSIRHPVILPNLHMVHGRKNKPSTPMSMIMNYSYAHEAQQKIEGIYLQRNSTEVKKRVVRNNRSQSLRQDYNTKKKIEIKIPFKMKQFLAIQPKVKIVI
ncbi:hypothetical protein pb186bvf_000326 [Paramecium bursaria]